MFLFKKSDMTTDESDQAASSPLRHQGIGPCGRPPKRAWGRGRSTRSRWSEPGCLRALMKHSSLAVKAVHQATLRDGGSLKRIQLDPPVLLMRSLDSFYKDLRSQQRTHSAHIASMLPPWRRVLQAPKHCRLPELCDHWSSYSQRQSLRPMRQLRRQPPRPVDVC